MVATMEVWDFAVMAREEVGQKSNLSVKLNLYRRQCGKETS